MFVFDRLKSYPWQPAIAGLLVTTLLAGLQHRGMLQSIELKVFDQMTQWQPDLPPDPRLLIVAITEQDIQRWQQVPLSDRILDTVFNRLEAHHPRVIGLDLFRDIPQEPGHRQLRQRLERDDRVVVICKHAGADQPAIAAAPRVPDPRIGFSDIVEDPDGVIRRNLLAVSRPANSPCAAPTSFSWQLVQRYVGNLTPTITDQDVQWGKARLSRLHPHMGGYQLRAEEARGFQILLKYRAAQQVARQVSLTDVLTQKLDPSWVKDRIVLIGSTAPSVKDIFTTPYSDGKSDNSGKMAGIVIHAQMTSQLLEAVLTGQGQFWAWPAWGEWLWALGWSGVGGALALWRPHPVRLGVAIGLTGVGLLAIHVAVFSQLGWIPIAPPMLGLIMTAGSVAAYSAHYERQQQFKSQRLLKEQEETIALLQSLLQEGGHTEEDTIALPTLIADTPRSRNLLNQRYCITALLGSGGFSSTYLATDTQRPGEPTCVVKHLQPARTDELFLKLARRLFKTEADSLELLGYHVQIPQLLAYFEENEQFYLIQEYIAGESLEQEVRSGKRYSEPQALKLLQDVLPVLVFVHGYGVIHRDLKPSNLIRRKLDGQIAVIDFGAVKQISPDLKENEDVTVAIGTVGYAPPEQFIGHPRFNSDLYALGMIAIQFLTGVPVKQLLRDSVTSQLAWRHLAVVSPWFADILDQMVAYDFSQRYQSAIEVLQALAENQPKR
jgi:CHASE2 domain-containing sensor protein/tRNA A-37 threonylcarbamoyl transferase component Bud32